MTSFPLSQLNFFSEDQLDQAFTEMIEGKWNSDSIKHFLKTLATRGESAAEIYAALKAMRKFEVRFEYPSEDLVDCCGTGGDGTHSFNVSTTAALIAAGAGAQVAKHGNRAVSSKSGSADVLEALGVKIDVSSEVVRRSIQETGFGFLFAPHYHSALKSLATIRKELGIRTVFNLVGPLANPAHVKRQLIGVPDSKYLKILAEALQKNGSKYIWVVYGNGMDEISLTAPTQICELRAGKFREFEIDPQALGLEYCQSEDLSGGDARVNAKMIDEILKGQQIDPRRDCAVLNAAAVLCVAEIVSDLKSGVEKANEAIDSGKALKVLEKLRKITQV